MGQMGQYRAPSKKRRYLIIAVSIQVPPIIWVLVIMFVVKVAEDQNAKTVQAEVKHILRDIYKAQENYHAANGVFASGPDCFSALGWGPEGNISYSYYCGSDMIEATRKFWVCDFDPPTPSRTGFPIYGVGNVDPDLQCDVWTIDEKGNLENVERDLWFP